MYPELIKYLKILNRQANLLARTDINGVEKSDFYSKYLIKITFVLISIGLTLMLKNGFGEIFISYVSSVLSILVGLFITALIFSFDKFYDPTKDENPSSRIKLWEIQAYNYAQKFAYLTSLTIIMSVFTLVVLILSTLFVEDFKLNLFSLEFCWNCRSDNYLENIWLFLFSLIVLFQRIFVLYWLLNIMYNTLFIVSSMVQYMTTKMNRK